MKVLVEYDDLERIVFATGVIKSIDAALNSFKVDPFVKKHLDYAEAHDRLASAMRNAKRREAETVVKFGEPPTEEELKAMRDVYKKEFFDLGAAIDLGDKSIWDTLVAKGYAEMGQEIKGSVWPGRDTPSIYPMAQYRVRLTGAGLDLIADDRGAR